MENLKRRHYLEDLGVDGKAVLQYGIMVGGRGLDACDS
jgi:hypothetical protein